MWLDPKAQYFQAQFCYHHGKELVNSHLLLTIIPTTCLSGVGSVSVPVVHPR